MSEPKRFIFNIHMDFKNIGEDLPTSLTEMLNKRYTVTGQDGSERELAPHLGRAIERIILAGNNRRLSDAELAVLTEVLDGEGREVSMGSDEWFQGMMEDDAQRLASEMALEDEDYPEYDPDEYDPDEWGDEWQQESEHQYPPD